MAAARADEAFAPAHLEQRPAAGLFAAEPLAKCGFAQPSLCAPQAFCRGHPPLLAARKAAETLAQIRMKVRDNQDSNWHDHDGQSPGHATGAKRPAYRKHDEY